MLVDHLPEARGGWIVRHALEHQRGGAVRQRPIDDVAVPRHPANVGGAPVNVAVVIVEHVLVGHRGVDEIAAGGVQHALRLSGRARCVENEQRVLRVHLCAGAFRRHHVGCLVIPDVPPRQHVDRCASAPDHDDVIDAAVDPPDRLVGIGLERHLAPAAQTFVGGDDNLGLTILDTAGERFRREAAKHH